MRQIIVLVGYARSGMTILNECLAADNRLICLSEINSRYYCPTPLPTPRDQLYEWYEKVIPKGDIVQEITSINTLAEDEGKTLLVRDWSFGSFVPMKYNDFAPPKYLNTVDDLKEICDVRSYCLVRNPIDVWLSMRNSKKTFHDRHLEYFLLFVKDVLARDMGIIRYENFCKSPLDEINKIYIGSNLEAIDAIRLSKNVTGDIDHAGASRGIQGDKVLQLDRRILSPEDRDFLFRETKVTEILELLHYSGTI